MAITLDNGKSCSKVDETNSQLKFGGCLILLVWQYEFNDFAGFVYMTRRAYKLLAVLFKSNSEAGAS